MNPLILISQTEKLLFEWVTQISVYCSRLCGFFNLNQALTITNNDGYVYFACAEKSLLRFVRQIS
jgi:hypothetical protein